MLPFARRCSVGWTLTRSPRENRSDPQDGQADELAPPGAPSRPMSAKSRQGKKVRVPTGRAKAGGEVVKVGERLERPGDQLDSTMLWCHRSIFLQTSLGYGEERAGETWGPQEMCCHGNQERKVSRA